MSERGFRRTAQPTAARPVIFRGVATRGSVMGLGLGVAALLACGQGSEAEPPAPPAEPATAPVEAAPVEPASMDADLAAQSQVQETGFVYKDIAVARESARAGDGQKVTLQGKLLVLKGEEIEVGDTLPEATLIASGMETVSIRDGKGHVRIVSVVPALMTPTCEQQTHYLSERNDGLEEQLELVTVSLDKPEVQSEFATKAGIENVTFLSDAPEASFGEGAGLLVDQPRFLARAVMVVDSENVVRYLQVVPEITSMPDMDAAFEFARSLVSEETGT